MEEYDDLMKQAATFRDLAEHCEDYRRRELINVAHGLEIKAKDLLRQSEDPPSKTE